MPRNPELQDITSHLDRLTFGEPGTHRPEQTEKPRPKEQATKQKAAITFDRILAAYDGSEGGEDALEWARTIAQAHKGKVLPVLVIPPTQHVWGGPLTGISEETQAQINQILEDEEKEGKKILKQAEQNLEDAQVDHEPMLLQGKTADEIVRLARSHHVDLVTVGSHGKKGLERVLLGSVSDVVKDRAGTNVLIAHNAPPIERILLAVDGSPLSYRAADILEGLAEALDAEVHLVHVLPLPFSGNTAQSRQVIKQAMEDIHRTMTGRFNGSGRVRFELLFGKPADRLIEYADEMNVDLIVMGARGLSKTKGFLLGSVSNRVAHQARASVLIVRDTKASKAEEDQ